MEFVIAAAQTPGSEKCLASLRWAGAPLLRPRPVLQQALQMIAGAVLGAAVALACQYLTFAANGGSYHSSATKARPGAVAGL